MRGRYVLSVLTAVAFAVVVMLAAASNSSGDIVKEAQQLQTPDSIYILTKDYETAKQIVLAFRSAAQPSTYSLSVAKPLSRPTVVSTYGNAPLTAMVVLKQHAVAADQLGLSTVIGNTTTDTGTSNMTGGGTTFTTGATNSNTGVTNAPVTNAGVTSGTIGVAAIYKVREALQRINPGLYTATLFNLHQVDENQISNPLPKKP
jgi:hypothetical protein